MAKYAVSTYTDAADLETAIEAIDDTVPIQVVVYHEGERQVFKLIVGA